MNSAQKLTQDKQWKHTVMSGGKEMEDYFSVTETCNGASTLLQNHFARDKSFKIVTASIRKSYYKGR